MNVMQVGFRIKQAIGLTGFNVKEFCEKTNRSRVTTALWISGRGGIMKHSSLEELCYDLRTCGVICNIEWLMTEAGEPPTLMTVQQAEKKQKNNLMHLHYDHNELELYLSRFNSNEYADYKDSKYYIIYFKSDLNNLPKSKIPLFFISTAQENIWGIYEGYCKTSNTCVLRTLENKLHCIKASKINCAGKIVTMISQPQ